MPVVNGFDHIGMSVGGGLQIKAASTSFADIKDDIKLNASGSLLWRDATLELPGESLVLSAGGALQVKP